MVENRSNPLLFSKTIAGRSLAAFISFFLLTLHCSSQNIIAYCSARTQNVEQYPINKLTHIIFSFCHLRGNRLSVSNFRDSVTIQKLVYLKSRNTALKILLSLGGWGGCKTCPPIFSTSAGRDAFTQSVLELTNYFHTDGIDIDWEFPALAGYPGHAYSPEDRNNFTALIQSLRQGLGSSKEISFIAAGFSPYLELSVDWKSVMPLVDRVNLMTYDIIGSRSPITGHHTSLYSSSRQIESADHAVRYLDSMGIPLSKVAIGIAFYGREFVDVADVNHGLYQPGKFKQFLSFKQIRRNYNLANGYREYWDDEAQSPYSYNVAKKSYLTYDNARSATAKAIYVKKNRLNGIMFWALHLDIAKGGLTDVIYHGLR